MLLYLDMCTLQRPLDDRTQIRIALEAEAILNVLAVCEAGQALLLSSDALEYETARNPNPLRKAHAEEILAQSSQIIRLSEEVVQRARRHSSRPVSKRSMPSIWRQPSREVRLIFAPATTGS